MTDRDAPDAVPVWDVPIRLFHWGLVALIGFAWWSAEQRELAWHRLAGYGILTLLLFRVGWGLWGSTTARFSHFVRGPKAVGAYATGILQRRAHPHIGHNPLGGWSIVALLGLLLIQVLLGLFAVDVDGMESGPLSYLVDFDMGRWAAETHDLTFNLLLGLIGLHLLAILFYRIYRREDLVGPMVHGRKRGYSGDDLGFASNWLALLMLAGVALAVWGLVAGTA
jgi:cytochrome b